MTIDGESESLDACLKGLTAKGARKLLINLAAVTQIDSSGISVIAATCSVLKRQKGEVKLLNPSGYVLEVLKALHLLEIIPGFQDEREALASFRLVGHAAKP